MASSPLEFDMQFGRAGASARRDPEAPFRLLVIGEFSGRAGAARATPLSSRRPRVIDLDRFDRVLAEYAPAIEATAARQPVTVAFESIDDFHPDRLYARLPLFAALRSLRAELQDPALYRRAAAALAAAPSAASAAGQPADSAGGSLPAAVGGPLPGSSAQSEARSESPATAGDGAPAATSAADDIARLLGRPPQTLGPEAPVAGGTGGPAAAEAAAGDPAAALIRAVVARHVVADTLREQQDFTAAADRAIAGEMRSLLHDPAFQRLEALWRALWRLLGTIEDSERVQVCVFDANLAELAADVAAGGGDLSHSALAALLRGPAAAPDGGPWSLVAFDHAFAPSEAEVVLLAALATAARAAGVPLLAGADPALAGAASAAGLADPAGWQPLPAAAGALWQQLRAASVAPWIGLALPRVLERLPYGAKTDPIDAFAFEELDVRGASVTGGAPAPVLSSAANARHGYLWSIPALALARLAVQAFQQDGWALELAAFVDLDDLPSHHYREGGESRQQACAEAYFSEAAGEALLARGLMPLMSYRNRNACRLLRWQSIASPAGGLAGFR